MQNCLKQTDALSLISPTVPSLQDKKAKKALAATTERLMSLLNEVVVEKASGPKSAGKTDPAYYGNIVLGAIKGYLNSNPELIKKIAQEGPALLAEAQKRVHASPPPSTSSSSGDSADSMAIAMMYLTSLEGEISKSRSDQDLQDLQIQADNVSAAAAEQTDIANQVAKQNKEIAKAAHAPWYEKILKWLVPVIVVVASFCTAGAGVAVAAALVGAFMASPLYGSMVSGISAAVSKALQDAGMPADKADAIGNIVGKVVAALVVVVLTLGVGGVSALASSGESAAADVAESVTEAAAEAGAETGADVAVNATTSTAAQYAKMAAFEFTTSIATSGIAQDALTAEHGTDWMESHSKLVAGITISSTIIGIIVSIAMGHVAFGGAASKETLIEKLAELSSDIRGSLGGLVSGFVESLPQLLRAITPLSQLAQATQGGVETALAFIRANILDAEAKTVKDIGQSQSEMSLMTSLLDLISDTQSKNDSSANSSTKLVGSEMDALKDNAGKDWATTAAILA